MKQIVLGDNAEVLPTLPAGFARLVYIDPPFNTGRVQKRDRMRVTATDDPADPGDRGGFGGRRYRVESVGSGSYGDTFDDFEAFLLPRIEASLRCLTAGRVALRSPRQPRGPLRQGRARPAARPRRASRTRSSGRTTTAAARRTAGPPSTTRSSGTRSTRTITSSTTTRSIASRTWRRRSSRRRRPSAARRRRTSGGTPSCPPTAARRPATRRRSPSGCSTASSRCTRAPGDVVLDFFAGSGTTGDAAARHGRGFVLVDDNPEAVAIAAARLAAYAPELVGFGAGGR